MKHSALINNVKSLEWGLTLAEAHVFAWLIDLPVWAEKIFIEGEVYYFASKTKAVDELPLITDKVDTMYRHYKSLESKGVIVLKKIDGKDFVSFTKKSKEWVFSDESDTRKKIRIDSENFPKTLGNKSDILNYNIIKSISDKKEDNMSGDAATVVSSSSNLSDAKMTENVSYFISQFNKIMAIKGKEREFKANDDVKNKLKKAIKQGYTFEDIKTALQNLKKDEYHVKTGFKYATPEFILRLEKLERFKNLTPVLENKPLIV